MAKAAEQKDWAAFAKELKSHGVPVAHVSGPGEEELLDTRLKSSLSTLGTQQTSPLIFIEGKAYVLRVVELEEVPPRPLNEVSQQIEAALTPLQLKKSLEKAGATALAASKVRYETRD